jgi:hypothetical protein
MKANIDLHISKMKLALFELLNIFPSLATITGLGKHTHIDTCH